MHFTPPEPKKLPYGHFEKIIPIGLPERYYASLTDKQVREFEKRLIILVDRCELKALLIEDTPGTYRLQVQGLERNIDRLEQGIPDISLEDL